MTRSLDSLESRLGYSFQRKTLLQTALTHRSAQSQGIESDYERLEYLGDAVLDLAVAHLLLDAHPKAREGELSKMRAALVNTQSLASIALELELSHHIVLSRAEIANGGAERPSILADVVEGIIGAIYRDSNYDAALHAVRKLLGEKVRKVVPEDPKTELQEALHSLGLEAPQYLLECVEGPEHAPLFISIVEVGGECFGRGQGSTKKASQQDAAAQALAHFQPQLDGRTIPAEEEE